MGDLYNGKVRKLAASIDVICEDCDGQGGKDVKTCTGWHGRGVKITTRQMGPGMIQQMQGACGECEGKGRVVPPGKKCKTCKGKRTKGEEGHRGESRQGHCQRLQEGVLWR